MQLHSAVSYKLRAHHRGIDAERGVDPTHLAANTLCRSPGQAMSEFQDTGALVYNAAITTSISLGQLVIAPSKTDWYHNLDYVVLMSDYSDTRVVSPCHAYVGFYDICRGNYNIIVIVSAAR